MVHPLIVSHIYEWPGEVGISLSCFICVNIDDFINYEVVSGQKKKYPICQCIEVDKNTKILT